eukprot:gnl/MRDRNA2_/MRDRNA2_116831_c0_seq1.p1 gnl/MRDRNA2_/MRDRNA2_116831_c0~~gnl/MRDRNA2_/MRDRNA2_116831_c0_seq1.p1  ORF type:complete len:501 (+),score=93.88 gnl/MRDRNA2_/MRDRNA2_116831_c0_seq1:60-1562(+)
MPADGVVALRQTALPIQEQVGHAHVGNVPSLRRFARNQRSAPLKLQPSGRAFPAVGAPPLAQTLAGRASFAEIGRKVQTLAVTAKAFGVVRRPTSPAGLSACKDGAYNNLVSDLALEAMGLGDEYIETALKQYRGMTSLHLGFNGLTENSMKVVGDAMASMRDLAYLDLWGNHIGVHGTAMLLRAVPGRRWTLRIVNLSQCGLSAGAVRYLAKYAAQAPLRAMALSGNPLGPDAAPGLAELLKTLVAADFSDCALGAAGARHFGKMLATSLTTCELLGLSWNNFGPNGLQKVLVGASKHVKLGGSLEALFLRGNGLLSEAAAKEVFGCVGRVNRTGLKHLDLARNAASQNVLSWLDTLPAETLMRIRKPTIPVPAMDDDEDRSGVEDAAAYAADEDDNVFWRHIQVVPDVASISADWKSVEFGDQCRLEIGEPKTLMRSHSEGNIGPRGSTGRATSAPHLLPSHRLDACRIPDTIPLRNRRNEVEAFEAFVFDRWRTNAI